MFVCLPFWNQALWRHFLQNQPDIANPAEKIIVWDRAREPLMSKRSVEELRRELDGLMREQVESLTKQTFGGLQQAEMREQEERLKRIREMSANYLAALKRELEKPLPKETPMASKPDVTDKPAVTLPGKVEKIIETPDPREPEQAQITVEGAETLYKELRIENTLTDENGDEVRLKEGAEVDVKVEADKDATEPKNENDRRRRPA
jgi:hypothetical protein